MRNNSPIKSKNEKQKLPVRSAVSALTAADGIANSTSKMRCISRFSPMTEVCVLTTQKRAKPTAGAWWRQHHVRPGSGNRRGMRPWNEKRVVVAGVCLKRRVGISQPSRIRWLDAVLPRLCVDTLARAVVIRSECARASVGPCTSPKTSAPGTHRIMRINIYGTTILLLRINRRLILQRRTRVLYIAGNLTTAA